MKLSTPLTRACVALQGFGSKAMFYMAAAVSDFYVPWASLPEHKIQSSAGSLDLALENVPKCLGKLTRDWAPNAFHVSFKLETDSTILLQKARSAIAKHRVHCVVANLLETRKRECAS